MKYVLTRRSLLFLGIASLPIVAIAASIDVGPTTLTLQEAEAQTSEADSVPVVHVQLPGWLPGEDFDPVNARENVSTETEPSSGTPTPTAPVVSADGATVVDAPGESGSMTTSLGGSDVAVSSVGGSYEVDSPKKRSKGKK